MKTTGFLFRLRCRRRARSVVHRNPAKNSMQDVIARMSKLNGRPIIVLPLAPQPGLRMPCGLWLSNGKTDFLFYDDSTAPYHAAAILAHEFGHLLAGHTASPSLLPGIDLDAISRGLTPEVDLDTVTGGRARTTFDSFAEVEAETIGGHLMDQMTRSRSALQRHHGDPNSGLESLYGIPRLG